MKKIGIEVSLAVAEAAKLADADVISAYPITPQTHIVERLADIVANGELTASYIPAESEHSALSACLGAAAVGARVFTATSSQGLELMHEVLYVASGMRLPMVMAVANRAISAPLSIWGDHSDAMAVRDTGWIQIFVENGQEAFDNTVCAFRIAEDPNVLLPVMVHMDGFHLTHMVEPIELLEQSQVAEFIPPYHYPLPLDPDKPVTMGGFAPPLIYTEAKKMQEVNFRASKARVQACWDEFGKRFGRYYKPVEPYRTEGARVLLMTMGSFSETASSSIDKMRADGRDVGLLKLKLWRPFPFEEFLELVKNAEVVIVLDRAMSTGGPGGPVCSEVKSALYNEPKRPKVIGFIGGLGGRDITVTGFEQMVDRGIELAAKGVQIESEMFGVRE